MKFICVAVISYSIIILGACTFDKGKNINPTTTEKLQTCDTSAIVSYSLHIAEIINTNCISCHGPTDNVKLNNHSNVQLNALSTSASIYSAVSRDGTVIPMPINKSLSECDIQKIKKWTMAGAPNN